MAEIASASISVASSLVSLGRAIKDYADFFRGVEDRIAKLQDHLKWMKAFLKEAEARQGSSPLIRQWASNVRDLAHESEDVIEIFLFKQAQKEKLPNWYTTHKIGKKINKLIERAEEISKWSKQYGAQLIAPLPDANNNKEAARFQEWRRTTAYDENEHFTGLDDTVRDIKVKLTSGGSSRFVISIYGAGGLGKTTLARKLLHDFRRTTDFDCHAWVCVSQVYKHEEVLLELIRSVTEKTDRELPKTIGSLELYLRDGLTEKQYMVVIDDVWETSVWESLKRAFPDNGKRSRVIITTRNEEVAKLPNNNNVYIHKLRSLDEIESWDLFYKKVNCFPTYSSLEDLGREMVKKCDGLPLAIVALAGLLSGRVAKVDGWKEVKDHLWKQLEKGSIPVNKILALSYDDLSEELAACFLYVGMYPKARRMAVQKLMMLWVAEGFIGQEEERCPEVVVKSYFDELVGRSLIQLDGFNRLENSLCRVHDLMRDWAIKKAKEIGFSRFCDTEENFSLVSTSTSCRRLGACCSTSWSLPKSYTNHSLRTLVVEFPISYPWESENFLQNLHKRFSVLRVLKLGLHGGWDKSIELPSQIGKLIHLRYLDLSWFGNIQVSSAIGKLKALQILIIQCGGYVSLSEIIGELKILRHLIGSFSNCHAIENSKSLQILDGVTAEEWCKINTTNILNLQQLTIKDISDEHCSDVNTSRFYTNFDNLKSLQILFMFSKEIYAADIDLTEIIKLCPSISELNLQFHSPINGEREPDWRNDLHEYGVNLQVIKLHVLSPEYDPINLFKKLPSLRALNLKIDNYHRHLFCSDQRGFLQLETLIVRVNNTSIKLDVVDGAMPLLKRLEFFGGIDVEVPKRLEHLVVGCSFCCVEK